jgi:hypothetical protein
MKAKQSDGNLRPGGGDAAVREHPQNNTLNT